MTMEKTKTLALDTPAASLALSPDENLLAVVGIHLFKIYTVHDDGHLDDFINIRSNKTTHLNYSSSDVEFCPTDNKVLASASTNGSVVVWNITSSGRTKPLHVFKDHCRAVNRVNFHPTDPHLILSGSQDGQMKLFDYRRQESVGTFSSNSESVRDIQFNPHIPHYFAAGTDSCNVQLWDIRRPDKYERLITGHRDHVFALDWHPVDRHCIATASRDYTIKIWDVSEQSLTVTSAISTVAAVARVKWRPNHYYHLASCSLTVDSGAFIWDVERPFVPIASFAYHRESTSALQWRSRTDSFLTVSKDGRLYHHCLKDAQYPRLGGCPFPLAISPLGHIAFAAPLRAANKERVLAEKASKADAKTNGGNHKRQTSFSNTAIGSSSPAPSSPASPFGPSSFNSNERVLTPLHPATPSLPPNPKNNEHLLNFPPPHMGMLDLANFEDIGPILSEFSLLRCSSKPSSKCEAGVQNFNQTRSLATSRSATDLVGRSHSEVLSKSKENKEWMSFAKDAREVRDSRDCSGAADWSVPCQEESITEDDGGCFSVDILKDYAINYKIDGSTDQAVVQSCDHNALISERNDRHQEANMWRILKVMFVGDETVDPPALNAGGDSAVSTSAAAAAGGPEKLNSSAGSGGNTCTPSKNKNGEPSAVSSPDKNSTTSPPPALSPPQPREELRERHMDDDRTIFRHEDEHEYEDSDDEDEAADILSDGAVHYVGPYNLRDCNARDLYFSDGYFDSLSAPVPDRHPNRPAMSPRRPHHRRLNDFQDLRRKIAFKDRPLSSNEEFIEIRDEAFEPKTLTSYKVEDPNMLGDDKLDLNHRDDDLDFGVDDQSLDHHHHHHHHHHDHHLQHHPVDDDPDPHHLPLDSGGDGGDSGEQESGGSEGKCVLASTMPLTVSLSAVPVSPPLDFSGIILDALKYTVLRGDLATCVTAVLVAGDRLKNCIPEDLLEHWFLMYLELLQRMRLFNQAAVIIKNASPSLPKIREMNQNSTRISMLCPHCCHPVGKRQFTCEKCHQVVNKCSWCNEAVKGLYVYCQGCSHGGHLQHLYNWFRENNNIYKAVEPISEDVCSAEANVFQPSDELENGSSLVVAPSSASAGSPLSKSSKTVVSSTPSTLSMRPFSSYFSGLSKHASTFTSAPSASSLSSPVPPAQTAPPPPPPPPPPVFNGNPFMGNIVGTNVFASPQSAGSNAPNFMKMANLVCPAGCGHLCQYM